MEDNKTDKAHVMVLPFHGQGHINPMLQFSKRLASKGLKITVATTLSNTTAIRTPPQTSITFESIYDDVINGDFKGPGGFKGYIDRFESIASKNLIQLIEKLKNSNSPIKCLVYDANLNWALSIAKEFDLVGAAFCTQSCAAIASYYSLYRRMISGETDQLPVTAGLPQFGLPELPSLGCGDGGGSNIAPIIRYILNQFDSIDQADWILFNSFDKLEDEIVTWMSTIWKVRTIGPTIPSFFLDKRVNNDTNYGFDLYTPDTDTCIDWLNSKAPQSVIYISFGSAASLNAQQMEQMTRALKNRPYSFIWVVKETEKLNLPTNFSNEACKKGLVVTWAPQLSVLSHKATGCFVTHCGWNSTMEALSFGVPMVSMPQFLDQMTNAHFVERVWGVGVRPKDENGVVMSDEIERCIEEIMSGGDRSEEITKNCVVWKGFAKDALGQNGSSDMYIDDIIYHLVSM